MAPCPWQWRACPQTRNSQWKGCSLRWKIGFQLRKSRNLQSYCVYRLSQHVSLGSDLVFVFSCRPLSSSFYFEELFLSVFCENKYRSLLYAFTSTFWIQPKLRVPKSTPWRVNEQLYSGAERRMQDCCCLQCKVQYFYGLGNRTWKHYHSSQTPPKLQQWP